MKYSTLDQCVSKLIIMMAASVLLGMPAHGSADPMLKLTVSGGNEPVEPGDVIVVTVRMEELGDNEAAGFQAFLEYDPQKLIFLSGEYTPTPFGLPILSPIEAVDGQIDLAAGVDPESGQEPTNSNATLAVMTFVVDESMSCVSTLAFREHSPPTRISDGVGEPIKPLTLSGLPAVPPTPDLTGDGTVSGADLGMLLAAWGPCSDCSNCPADLTCSCEVDGADLGMLLAAWGPVD